MRKIVLLLTLLVACGDSRLSPQGGTITSVNAGSGATGGGTGGSVTVNVVPAVGGGLVTLADSVGMLTTCGDGQILKWTAGTASWGCLNDSSASGAISMHGALAIAQFNDWNPSGLGTNPVIQISAGDNNGSLITGIAAIAAGVRVGDMLTLCNTNAYLDDGVLMLDNESTASLANNRIQIPGAGIAVAGPRVDRYTIPPASCQTLIYMTTVPTDLTVKRWVVVGGSSRKYRSVIQSLQLFPDNTPIALTSGATTNDWDPVDTCPQVPGAVGGSCEAGGSTNQKDYTVIRMTTSTSATATLGGIRSYYDTVGGNYNGEPSGLGPVKLMVNYGPGDIVFQDDSFATSGTGNEFSLVGDQAITVKPLGSLLIWHSNHDATWYVIGGDRGGQLTTSSVSGTTNTTTKFTGANAVGNAWPLDDGTTWGVTGRFTITEATGNTTISGFASSPQFMTPGRLVPTALTSGATTDNWNPASLHSFQRIVVQTSTGSTATLAGIDAGSDGEYKEICNFGSGPVSFTNEALTSTAANRFWLYNATTLTLPGSASQAMGCATLRYEGANSRWMHIATSGASGESTIAGAGLTLTGSTVDVVGGTGLSVVADAVNLALSVQDCAAGSFFDSNTTTGVFSCVAEVGDISAATVTANMGLQGGGTSGAVAFGMLSTCADGQVLKSGATGTTWTCANDTGETTIAGAGLTLTGTTVNLIGSSDFSVGADLLDLSTAVTAPGSLDVAADLTIGGGQVYFTGLEMNFGYNTNATTSGYINYLGYLHGSTQFRDLTIADGKGATIATFTGSTKAVSLAGALTVTGVTTTTGGLASTAAETKVGNFSGQRIAASLAANANDWAPTGIGTAMVIDLTSVAVGPFVITGISSTGSTAGRVLVLLNNGGNTFQVVNESGSSLAANRIRTTGGATRTIGNYGSISFVWNGTNWSEIAEASRFTPELYSLGALQADGVTQLIGAVTHYGNTTLGDADTDTVVASGTLQALRFTAETQLSDHRRGFEFWDDFLSEPADGGNWQVNGAAGVSTSGYALNRPGVLFLETQADGVGAGLAAVAVFQGDNTLGEGSSWYAGGGVTEFEVSGMFEVIPTSTPSFEVAMGLMSTNTVSNSNEGVYCKATAGSANWQACTAENAVATCADTSPVVAKAINNWVRCSAVVNAAGTSVTFTIKDITTGTTGTLTQTATIPDNILYQAGLSFVNNRVGTTGGGFFFADYAWFNQTFTTAR